MIFEKSGSVGAAEQQIKFLMFQIFIQILKW